ncbi:hypothetical protein PSCLAVI8L_210012 [Pseudoclavibacter sp. 8L]|nr:hypothetical protein PSCLAVI8L_210012 [Pseudoclavibacter sp. 8L]
MLGERHPLRRQPHAPAILHEQGNAHLALQLRQLVRDGRCAEVERRRDGGDGATQLQFTQQAEAAEVPHPTPPFDFIDEFVSAIFAIRPQSCQQHWKGRVPTGVDASLPEGVTADVRSDLPAHRPRDLLRGDGGHWDLRVPPDQRPRGLHARRAQSQPRHRGTQRRSL